MLTCVAVVLLNIEEAIVSGHCWICGVVTGEQNPLRLVLMKRPPRLVMKRRIKPNKAYVSQVPCWWHIS